MSSKTADNFFRLVHDQWPAIQSRFGVRRIGIFGSCVSGRELPGSDIDVLVEFDRKTFDNYMGLKFFLEDYFGKKVDLVVAEAIKPALREYILKEVKYAA